MTDSEWLATLMKKFTGRSIRKVRLGKTGNIHYQLKVGGTWKNKVVSPKESSRIAEDFKDV